MTGPAATASGGPTGLDLLLLSAGYVVWSLAFLALYAGHAIGCRLGWNEVPLGPLALDRALLLATWAVFVAAGAWLLRVVVHRSRRPGPGGRFMRHAIGLATGTALLSTLWTGLPLLATSTCA